MMVNAVLQCLSPIRSSLFVYSMGACVGCRTLSTTTARFCVMKRARLLNRFIGGSKRKKWHLGGEYKVASTPFAPPKSKGSGSSRRASVLNTLLMEAITDVMSTGEVGNELQGFGIEISRVHVSNDCQHISVYWIISGSDLQRDSTVESKLSSVAGRIRSQLCSYHILGKVPFITFVRDKSYSYLAEVERLLKIADFGPDHVPADPACSDKTDLVLRRQLQSSLQAAVNRELEKSLGSVEIQQHSCMQRENLDSIEITAQTSAGLLQAVESNTDPSETKVVIPPMRTNVFGLDHDVIMKQVMQRKKKIKGEGTKISVPKQEPTDSLQVDGSSLTNSVIQTPDTNQQQSPRLRDFIKQRKRLQQRVMKAMKEQQEVNGFLEDEVLHGDSFADRSTLGDMEEDFFDDEEELYNKDTSELN